MITGYRAELEPKALGYTLSAIMRVRPSARQLPKVAELARESPEVVECHRITGEDCFYLKLHLRDIEHLEEVVDRFLIYGQTTTSIIQSSPVRGRGVCRLRRLAPRCPASTPRCSSSSATRRSSGSTGSAATWRRRCSRSSST